MMQNILWLTENMEWFLIRTGQKEASRKLWEDYKEKEKAELLDDSESRNLQLWEEINEKKKRK